MSAGEFHLAAPPETLDEDPRLRDLMTGRLVAITADSDVHVALRLMVTAQVRHLPGMDGPECLGVVFERDVLHGVLVHDGDRLIGIVTATDIIRSLVRAVPWRD